MPYLLTWRDRDMSEAPGQLQISVLWNLRSDMLAGRDISGRTEPRTKARTSLRPQFLRLLAGRGLSPNSKWAKELAGLDNQRAEVGPGWDFGGMWSKEAALTGDWPSCA